MASLKSKFDREAAIIKQRRTNEAAVINAAIADTQADFAQYQGLNLAGTDPITGAVTEYTTLDLDTAAYDGTTNNAIDISLDGGTTVFTTVTAHADDIPYVPPRLYYKAAYKVMDGTKEGESTQDAGDVVGSSAYDIIKALGIQGITA